MGNSHIDLVLDCTKEDQHTWTLTSSWDLTQGPLGAESYTPNELAEAQQAGSLTEHGEALIRAMCLYNGSTTQLDENKRTELVITVDEGILNPEQITNLLKGLMHDIVIRETARTRETISAEYKQRPAVPA